MKVVIPVEQARVDSPISSIFGRSPFFYLFDSETNQGSFLESTFLFGQSAGIQAAQLMIDHGVDVLISNRCGENAMRLLSARQHHSLSCCCIRRGRKSGAVFCR